MATTAPERAGGEELVARVQELQDALAAAGDSPVARLADELVAAIVGLYGEGLARIMQAVGGGDGSDGGGEGAREELAGPALAAALAQDPLVATLLLIHDLHPVGLRERIEQALDSVRPYMESHGGDVRLLSLEDGVARISLRGSCSDCSASSVTLELAIKQALEEWAPDLAELVVEGVAPPPVAPPPVTAPAAGAAWYELDRAVALAEGSLAPVTVAGHRLVLASVDGTPLAYEDRCAGCGSSLAGSELVAGALTCSGCGRAFALPRAGRSLDGDGLQLAPVPLLREDGALKVALAG